MMWVTLTLCYCFYLCLNHSQMNKTELVYQRPQKVPKKIAVYNLPNKKLEGADLFAGCEISNCIFMNSESNVIDNDTDAVFMNGLGLSALRPQRSKRGQIWLYYFLESPHRKYYTVSRKDSSFWRDKINWTATYRLDSDIPVFYGAVTQTAVQKNYAEILLKKRKLVAWVVSNCKTPGRREDFVKILRQYIPVDIYGRCDKDKKKFDPKIFEKISTMYKFYLGFENSLCRDYITEKFFLRQNMDAVIIVRGEGNYSNFYPKASYIDTRDFSSIKTLAEYLLYLDKNDDKYVGYLKAKEGFKDVNLIPRRNTIMCRFCKMLNAPEAYRKVYSDFRFWQTNKQCHPPTDLQ